ncbi:MAG: hypothetical protein JSW07_11575 [bacterium]|nr:MAG: hypothetical protein JSW07_11575 [bacterium]
MMNKYSQFPPLLFIRSASLCLRGRVHFPKNRIGEVVKGQEDYVIFRHVMIKPIGNRSEKPGVIFKVKFQFTRFSTKMNKILSLIPVPFIVAQTGFRSKIWLLGKKTGTFQGVYKWDTVEDVENYWTSFPMSLMKRRAVPESLSYEILEI